MIQNDLPYFINIALNINKHVSFMFNYQFTFVKSDLNNFRFHTAPKGLFVWKKAAGINQQSPPPLRSMASIQQHSTSLF